MSTNPYQPPRENVAAVRASPLPVRVRGELRVEDAIKALKSVGKFLPSRYRLILLPVLGFVTIFAAMIDFADPDWSLLFAWGVCAIIAVWLPWRARRRFINQWNNRSDHHHPVAWTFSEEGLLTETLSSKALNGWSAFIYAKITSDNIVLAQQGGMMFNYIPRRFFESEGDWLAVRNLLASKLTVRETGR